MTPLRKSYTQSFLCVRTSYVDSCFATTFFILKARLSSSFDRSEWHGCQDASVSSSLHHP